VTPLKENCPQLRRCRVLHSPDQHDAAGPTTPETTAAPATVTPITSAIRTLHTADAEKAVTVCDRAHRNAVADAEQLEAELATVVIALDSDPMTVLRANDRKRSCVWVSRGHGREHRRSPVSSTAHAARSESRNIHARRRRLSRRRSVLG
jgi:hypothetical protein